MEERMNIPMWPDGLPIAPLLADYNETKSSLAQSVTTGNKSILLRRNSTRAQDKLNVSFALNREQTAAFEQFFYDTLAGGTLRFSFRHPRTLKTIEASFDPTSDQAITIAPMESMKVYKVSFTLIIWN